jgi:hypothetical protein
MASNHKIVQVYIPVIMSDIIYRNGLTEDIDFYIERLFLAYNVNSFAKLANYELKDYAKAAMVVLGAIGTAYGIYKNIWSVKGVKNTIEKDKRTNDNDNPEAVIDNTNKTKFTSNNTKKNDNKKTAQKTKANITPKNTQTNSASLIDEDYKIFKEDNNLVLSNPSEVVIKDTLIRFKSTNFLNKNEISNFRKAPNKVNSFIKRIVSQLKGESINVVTNSVFYVYSSSEVSKSEINGIMNSDKNANVVVVDTVNNLVTAVMRNKGAIITNTIKLSKLTNDRNSSADEETIDRVIKSLKSIKVSKF